MKFLNLLLILFISVTIINCGESNDAASSPNSKPINSEWVSDVNGANIDLSGMPIGSEKQMYISLVGGSLCKCTALILGTETKGTLAIYNCLEKTTGKEGSSTCDDIEGSNTYEIKDSVFTGCDGENPDDCSTFR